MVMMLKTINLLTILFKKITDNISFIQKLATVVKNLAFNFVINLICFIVYYFIISICQL